MHPDTAVDGCLAPSFVGYQADDEMFPDAIGYQGHADRQERQERDYGNRDAFGDGPRPHARRSNRGRRFNHFHGHACHCLDHTLWLNLESAM